MALSEQLRKPLKACSVSELEALAAEIRETVIQTVETNGGHLSPNLGMVELTLALYFAFDFPADKLLFDVGHQSYIKSSPTVRSGFPRCGKRAGSPDSLRRRRARTTRSSPVMQAIRSRRGSGSQRRATSRGRTTGS